MIIVGVGKENRCLMYASRHESGGFSIPCQGHCGGHRSEDSRCNPSLTCRNWSIGPKIQRACSLESLLTWRQQLSSYRFSEHTALVFLSGGVEVGVQVGWPSSTTIATVRQCDAELYGAPKTRFTAVAAGTRESMSVAALTHSLRSLNCSLTLL